MTTFSLEQFAPGEAAAITGCTVPVQNAYRARRLIPSNGGKNAVFDAFGLAFLLSVRTMNQYDLGFTCAQTVGSLVVSAIVRRALRYKQAFDLAGLYADTPDLGELAAEVMASRAPSHDAGRFLVAWPNGEMAFCNDLGPELFEAAAAHDPRHVIGGAVIFDTETAAHEILRRAGRPLVRVGARPVPFEAFQTLALAV